MQNTSPQSARRFLTQELASLEVYGKEGKILAKMANVSVTGAFFEIINAPLMPKKDDLVRITINLRAVNKTHVIESHVVWSKGLGLGVEFLTRDDINSKLSKLLSKIH